MAVMACTACVLPFAALQVFTFKWSVNWAFLPEEFFVSRQLAMGLMFLHLRALWRLAQKHWSVRCAVLRCASLGWFAREVQRGHGRLAHRSR